MTELKKHHECRGCGLKHHMVEAGGLYYCPNPACTVSGASWAKRLLPSTDESTCCYYESELIRFIYTQWEETDINVIIACELMLAKMTAKRQEEYND